MLSTNEAHCQKSLVYFYIFCVLLYKIIQKCVILQKNLYIRAKLHEIV